MSTKEDLIRLIELLPASEHHAARRFLQFLIDRVADEDTEPLSSELAREADAAWAAYTRGEDPGEPLDSVRNRLLKETNE